MLKLRRTWFEDQKQFIQLKYIERDFYGPWINLTIERKEEIIPIVEVEPGSYGFENASVAEGINKTMVKVAKEVFEQYGEFNLISKYGVIPIVTEDAEKAIKEFQEKIVLF